MFVSSRETTLRDIIKALSTRRRRGGGGREANAVNDVDARMDARSATARRPKKEEAGGGKIEVGLRWRNEVNGVCVHKRSVVIEREEEEEEEEESCVHKGSVGIEIEEKEEEEEDDF